MEKILSKYKKMFIQLKEEHGDNEVAHGTQDEIYRKFIKDIASGKFETKEDIVFLAKEIKKNTVTSNECNEKFTLMNSYISILHTYVNKILDHPNFLLEKQNLIVIIDKTIKNFHNLDSTKLFILNYENITEIEKIIEILDFLVYNINDFFEINHILFKKIENMPLNSINNIYKQLNIDFTELTVDEKHKLIKNVLS